MLVDEIILYYDARLKKHQNAISMVTIKQYAYVSKLLSLYDLKNLEGYK